MSESKIRYIEYELHCPSCGQPGGLYVSYRQTKSGWVAYFSVKHRKCSYDRNRYRLFRRHGYTSDETMKYSGCSRPIEVSSCSFGRKYPARIRKRVLGPNESKRIRGHCMKTPRRPLDSSWSPNKPRVFLTKIDAYVIRLRYALGMTQTQLAEKYRVAQSQISFIVNHHIF